MIVDRTVYLSGQIGIEPQVIFLYPFKTVLILIFYSPSQTGKLVGPGVREQMIQVCDLKCGQIKYFARGHGSIIQLSLILTGSDKHGSCTGGCWFILQKWFVLAFFDFHSLNSFIQLSKQLCSLLTSMTSKQ